MGLPRDFRRVNLAGKGLKNGKGRGFSPAVLAVGPGPSLRSVRSPLSRVLEERRPKAAKPSGGRFRATKTRSRALRAAAHSP